MEVKNASFGESRPAIVAVVVSFLSMDLLDVHSEVVYGRVGFAANVTAGPLLAVLETVVRLQAAFRFESFVAEIAEEGSLGSVHRSMSYVGSLVCEN